jgi:two-component system NtrC family sensor kinase
LATQSRSRRRAVSFSPDAEAQSILAALADIAARMTIAGPTELVAQDVLERARAAVRAEECAVWLDAGSGLARTWTAGFEEIEDGDVTAALAGEAANDLRVVDMRFGPRRVGVLAIRLEGVAAEIAERFAAALASMLAAFVANSERSRRLESDLQARMRETEEQKRFTERIVDLLPLGLYVIDRDYRITVWNRNRETGMQGVARDDALGRPLFEILHRQPADVLRREFEEAFRTGVTQQFQMESSATGTLRTYRLSKIPMRDPSGVVTHVITIGEDITDWVEAREAVAQNEKLAAIGRLAAGIMHEINNPLATIAACAESLALIESPREGEPQFIRIIESEVGRCKRIVDGLLDFSRPRPRERQLLDVNGVAERALFLMNHHARFKQLTVERSLADALPMVHASAEQLIQVLIALLTNAADAMPQYGRVRIRTLAESPRGPVVIEVQDEGTGMNRAQMARIFEPFYSTKEQGRGTGLGLAICHGIIADHGGRVDVTSEEGQGSTFRVVLPAGDA